MNTKLVVLTSWWCLVFSAGVVGSPLIRTVVLSRQQAPGFPNGVTFLNIGTDQRIDGQGRVAFTAELAGTSNEERFGIWIDDSGSLAPIVRSGFQAPGMPTGMVFKGYFSNLALGPGGDLVFNAAAGENRTGSVVNIGYWSGKPGSLSPAFLEGDMVHGFEDSPIILESDFAAVNSAGQVVSPVALGRPGSNTIDSRAIIQASNRSVTSIARTGDQATGAPSGTKYLGLGVPFINARGDVAFGGYVTGDSQDSRLNQAIWSNSNGELELIAGTGDLAPGTTDGTRFDQVGKEQPITLNSIGDLAFAGTLTGPAVDDTNRAGIWRGRAGALSLIIRAGEHAPHLPSGVVFKRLEYPSINSANDLAFFSKLSSSDFEYDNVGSIWKLEGRDLRMIAQEGGHAPGTPPNVVFKRLGGDGPLLNSAGQIVFGGDLTGGGIDSRNNLGIWATDRAGVVRLIVRTGDAIEVAPGDLRTVSTVFSYCYGRSDEGSCTFFNAQGQFVFFAQFTDNSSGIFVSNVGTLPEPHSFTIVIWALLSLATSSFRRQRKAC